MLNTAQIINQSAPERPLRIRIDVRVPYVADLDVVEACMSEAAEAADSVLESSSPQVRIKQYADRGIEYELQVHVSHPTRQVRARHEVYRDLAAAFDREDIEPPYAGREIPPLDDATLAERDGRPTERDPRTKRHYGGMADRDSRTESRAGRREDRDGHTESRDGRNGRVAVLAKGLQRRF